jgi:hypothetical protein
MKKKFKSLWPVVSRGLFASLILFAEERRRLKLGVSNWQCKSKVIKRNSLRAIHYMTLGIFEDILYVRTDF